MKISVFGLGISAISVLKFLKTTNDEVFVVNKEELSLWENKVHDISSKFNCIHENDSEKVFEQSDLIILSPGIPRSHIKLKKAILKNISVESEIEFTFNRSKVPVIAVTGSNGKTTTCEMIKESLQRFGKKVFLGGNIGHAYSNILLGESYDYAVVEVSSFQLESINLFRPVISVITNVTPNHMERYDSFNDYKNAKLNILKNQENELLISDNRFSYEGDFIEISEHLPDYSFKKTNMPGAHNRKNFFCALKICENIVEDFSRETFQSFINDFKGPKYRLEFLGIKNNKSFYNDAKSTNLESTLTAIKSFSSLKNVSLILGGKLRDGHVNEFIELKKYHFKEIFVIGEAAKQLSEILDVKIKTNLIEVFESLDNTEGVVLFSPGFPSFDQYKNYIDRGEDFSSLFKSIKAN